MENLNVVFVVESSLDVLGCWQLVISEYFTFLIKRLADLHPNVKYRIGFITYATADTLPSPIISKRFFSEFNPVTKAIREDYTKLGIGHTASGGLKGMSALEGLVAAIEMSDTFISCAPAGSLSHFYLFQVAASAPDASIHPQCNDCPDLDNITWDTLPAELQKRKIHYGLISLVHNLPRFAELHAATSKSSTISPWFSVRQNHTILLNGFPVPTPAGPWTPPLAAPSKAKRPAEQEKSPEANKRARVAPKSSPPPPPPPSQTPVQPPSATQTPTQTPARPPTTTPPQNPVPQNPVPQNSIPPQQVMQRLRQLEIMIANMEKNLTDLQNKGETQKAEVARQSLEQKRKQAEQFKKVAIYALRNGINSNSLPPGIPVPDNGQVNVALKPPLTPPTVPQTGLSPQTTPPTNPAAVAAAAANRLLHQQRFPQQSPPNTIQQINPPNPNPMQQLNPVVGSQAMSPNPMALQMQKLLEHTERTGQNNTPRMQNQVSPMHPPTSNEQPGLQQQPPSGTGQPPSKLIVWHGVLMFSGTDAQGLSKEQRVSVFASANPTGNLDHHSHTWPSVIQLMPSREPPVPTPELQAWIKRTRPVLCTLQPDPRGPDAKANQGYYTQLVQMLTLKKMFAVAQWTLPNGRTENMALLFTPESTMGSVTLFGAFFPLNGIPEMPRSSTNSNPVAAPPNPMGMGGNPAPNAGMSPAAASLFAMLSLNQNQMENLNKLPAAQKNQLIMGLVSKLPPDQQRAFLAKQQGLMAFRQQQVQQQQVQQQQVQQQVQQQQPQMQDTNPNLFANGMGMPKQQGFMMGANMAGLNMNGPPQDVNVVMNGMGGGQHQQQLPQGLGGAPPNMNMPMNLMQQNMMNNIRGQPMPYEVMQSFMQRNAGPLGGPPNGGMGPG